MAEKPIKTPLPADLPEDWNAGQIIAPTGEEVDLSHQHGYNYLMKMVNRTQESVNAVNDAFETISGKRTCRAVVGTAAAGWTEAECDFLCDGVDDQEEINKAIQAISGANQGLVGGEILILSGVYHLTGYIAIPVFREGAVLRGCGRTTVLVRDNADVNGILKRNALIHLSGNSELRDMVIVSSVDAEDEDAAQIWSVCANEIRNICFSVTGFEGRVKYGIIADNTYSNGVYQTTCIENCEFGFMDTAILLNGGQVDRISISSCLCRPKMNTGIPYPQEVLHFIGTKNLSESKMYLSTVSIFGNQAPESDIILDAISVQGVNIFGNIVLGIEIKDSTSTNSGDFAISTGNIIEGNILRGNPLDKNKPVISLGQNARFWFVTGNQIQNLAVLDGSWPVTDKGEKNIIRFNSDDTGGGEGGTAGVTAFNGRSGRVSPAAEDYTAAMVGAIPASAVKDIQTITQAAYDALTTKSPTTLYLIEE